MVKWETLRDKLFKPLLQVYRSSAQAIGYSPDADRELSLRHIQLDAPAMAEFCKTYEDHRTLSDIIALLHHIPNHLCVKMERTNRTNWIRRWSDSLLATLQRNLVLEDVLQNEGVASLCGSVLADVSALSGLEGHVFHNLQVGEEESMPLSQKNTQERVDAEERREMTLYQRAFDDAASEVSKVVDAVVKAAFRKGITFPTSEPAEGQKKAVLGLSPAAAQLVDAIEKVLCTLVRRLSTSLNLALFRS